MEYKIKMGDEIMREIKFRVWNGYRMFSDETLRKNAEEMYTKLGIRSQYMDDIMIPNNKDLVVMQYTGLKDVNDREIYEGDIVEVSNCMLENESDFIGFIEYNNGGFKINNRSRSRGIDDIMLSLKVIGNIYENLELLS